MELHLKTYPNKHLTTPCELVSEEEFGSLELELICGRMLSIMHSLEGLGLAANQVGIQKRIFVFQNKAEDGIDRGDIEIPEIFINPRIFNLSSTEYRSFKEGCLSFPGSYHMVERKEFFIMSYQDINGNVKELGPDVCCGLFGHAFQHEVDHLNGITMLDKVNIIDKEKMLKKINKLRARK